MLKLKKHEEYSSDLISIYYFDEYIPKYTHTDDGFSNALLVFKETKDVELIDFFSKLIQKQIKDGQEYVVCLVPSTDMNEKWPAIRHVAYQVRKEKKLIMGEHIILRNKTIPKQKIFRNSIETHLESLSLFTSFKDVIKNQKVILFDDIITTGTSFNACAKLLLEDGAKKIIGIVLGKTKKLYK